LARENLLGLQGRHAEALVVSQDALRLTERYYGPRSFAAADAHDDIASEFETTGEYSKSAAECREALSIYDSTPGAWPLNVAIAFGNLAVVEDRLGHSDAALEALRRAEAILTGNDEESMERRRWLTAERVIILEGAGRVAEAEALFAQARSSWESATPTWALSSSTRTELLAAHARALLRTSRTAEAVEAAREANQLGEAKAGPLPRAIARFTLAQALVAANVDRHQAIQLATQALEGFGGPEDARGRKRIEDWIAAEKRRIEPTPSP
jgi:tetratricopeptide (TPR) repeat protein